ncbi:MAG: ABC transporter permease [Blautia sp.]|nr:ABC transporter permease [Blautia sp.]
MEKKALRKDFFMEIRKSRNRFLSILLIVALGVAFYSGIQSAAPDMRYSGDAYFDEHKLMDLKVIGTLGLTERDVEAVLDVEGVAKAEPGYMTDALCGEETQKTLHLESISDSLNQLTPIEGRLPEKSGECFVDIEFFDKSGYELGDEIRFYLDDPEEELPLKQDTYTIVGAGSTPLYISFSRGNTTLGNGEISGVGYLQKEDFDSEVYTQIYMEVYGARDLTAYTDAYDTLIANVMERVKGIEDVQCEARYREVLEEGQKKLSDARQELEDGKKEGEEELFDARKKLEDGEKELEDGKKELEDAKQKVKDGEKELIDAKKELEDGEKEIADNRKTIEEKEQELSDGKAQLADGWAKLNSGKQEFAAKEAEFNRQYQTAMQEITSGEEQLRQAKEQLAQGKKQYKDGLAKYKAGKKEYKAGEEQYQSGLKEFQKQESGWKTKKQELTVQREELVGNQSQLEAALPMMTEQLQQFQAQREEVQTQRDGLQKQLEQTTAQESQLQQVITVLNENSQNLQNNVIPTLQSRIQELQGQIDELHIKAGATDPESEEYAEYQAQLAALEGQMAALTGELTEAQQNLETIPAQLAEAQNGLAACQQGIIALQEGIGQADAGLGQIDAGMQTLQTEISTQTGNLEKVKAGIGQIDAGITQAETELENGRTKLADSRTQLDAAKAELEATPAKLDAARKEIEAGEKEIAANEKKLKEGRKQLEDGKNQIDQAKNTIAVNEQKLVDSQAQITSGEAQLADARKQIAEAEEKIADGWKEYEDGKKELEDGRKEIEDGEKEIADAEKELSDGWKEYEDGRKEFEEEITDAEKKITDAEEELADLKTPEWIVSDRSDLPDNIGYGENADRMRNIGRVFPVLFFLVAALISLTTMTRMVEEQRTQIGTLKALGYGKMAIASKYLLYALFATLAGSIIGILAGERIIPFVIVTAYKIMYHHMPNIVLPYNLKYGLIATGAALFSTMFATFSSCYKELAATPAVMMRPPAPKDGKRVILEYFPFIWKPLSFSWKSTVRNLFRYKKRFLMTIFGIGGCMGLMIVGYGLQDSIMDVARLQYRELQLYDGMVIMDADASEQEKELLEQAAGADERIGNFTKTMMRKDSVQIGKKKWDLYLMVPEDMDSFRNFVVFRDRVSKESKELGDRGAILTEKIAKAMNLKVGDSVVIENEDYGDVSIPVTAITENYLSHYIYMTPAVYEQYYGEKPQYNELLYQAKDAAKEEVMDIGESLMTYDAALSVSYTASLMAQLDSMLTAMDDVMIVLIVSAGLLAFVVLYNLNNININERKRELATIKVLGFYNSEVDMYVYRENILLTIFGILLGVGIGKLLHRFIIETVEVDACMFGRNVNLPSFFIAAAYTAGFSIIVNVVMHFKLKKIDMVESLKSVE